MIAVSDIQRWQGAEEGQFFERKSAFDRVPGRPKQRKAADIVETLSTMANADGGELVIGIESDGTLTEDGTGHHLWANRVILLGGLSSS